MQQIPQSQHLSGQCPNCGWTPPLQNAFRPNIMNEYIGPDGKMVILSETDDQVKSPAGIFLRNKDDNGQKIRRAVADKQPNNPLLQQVQKTYEELNQQPPQQIAIDNGAGSGIQTSGYVAPVTKTAPTGILPSKEIPIGLMKTPEEVAATLKDKVTPAPVVLPTPTMSNAAAPAQTANTQTDIKQP